MTEPLREILTSSSKSSESSKWMESSISQLKLRTDQAKEEVYEMIAAHKSQFSQTFDAGREIESQVNFVSQSLKEIENFSRDPKGEVKSAMRNHESRKRLSVQIERTKNAIDILSALKSIHNHFKDVDSALDLSDSVTAANRISTLHTEMKGLAEKLKSTEEEERVSASRLLRYLRVKFRQKRSLVRDRLSEDFESMLSVVQSSTSSTENSSLGMIILRMKRGDENKDVSSRLVRVLSALRTVGKLDDLLSVLLNDLDRIFFIPLTRTATTKNDDEKKNDDKLQVKRSKRRDGDFDRITLTLCRVDTSRDDEEEENDERNQEEDEIIDRMFDNVARVLQFIFTDILGENKTIAQAIGRSLWRRSNSTGLEMRCLSAMRETLPRICSARKMTSAQKWLTRETKRFLKSVSLFHTEDPKQPSLLLKFVNNLPEHLTQTRRRRLLREARDVIRQDRMFESTTFAQSESSVQSQSLLQQLRDAESSTQSSSNKNQKEQQQEQQHITDSTTDGYFAFPQCRVTDCARKLVSLSREALQEATVWSLDSCSKTLLLTARDVIDLYRALAPVAHEREISNDTRIPMLLHNDCIFLAHHALFVAHMFREGLPESLRPVATLVDLVPPLRRMAEDAYVQLIERQQRRVLKDFVGFEKVVASWDTSSSSSNDRVVDEVEAELSVKRVVDVIEKLSLDWSDVLPKSVHIHSIARLAELVANRALDTILGLRSVNITAIPKLLHVLSLLLSLESRLKSTMELKSESTQWHALCQVSELLTEYRSHTKAENRSKSMSELGETRARKIIRLLRTM